MTRHHIRDDDMDAREDSYEWPPEQASHSRARLLASRRRIEDLKELRRMREEFGDEDFLVDLN